MMSDSINQKINGSFEERARFIIASRYKILSTVAKLLTILLTIGGLIGAVGFYRLPPEWVTPSFQMALSETVGPVQVTIPDAQIRWGGWRHPFGIHVRHVTIQKEESALTLKIPTLLLSLKLLPLLRGKAEIGRCSFDSAKIYAQSRLIGELSGKAKRRRHKAFLHVDFQKLDATALIHLSMGRGCPLAAPFPFLGTLILEGSPKTGLTKMKLFCKTEGGVLAIPELYPQPLTLDKTEFLLTGSEQGIILKEATLRRGETTLTVHGELHSSVSWKALYEGGGKIDLSVEGKGAAIPVDDLHLLWPHGLSPKPRRWVVHQLSKGKADNVTTQMHGIIAVEPRGKVTGFNVPHIQGQIEASGITVDYFGKLPPVVKVSGKCSFTRQQFAIDAVGVANGIQMKKAKIVINDTHLEDQTIDIALGLEGPVRNCLEIINAAPLFLAQKLDLDPARISGQAVTDLHLNFPLETDVPLDLVKVSAKSQIKGGEILYDTKVDGKPIKLDEGTFALDVSKKFLKMEGQGNIQGVKARIQWQEYFENEAIPFRRQFLLQGNLDLQKLKNFGINAAGYLEGKAKTNIQYTVSNKAIGVVEGFSDLTSAIMVSPVLSWQKAEGASAHLKFKMRKDLHQQVFTLDEATLIAPNLALVIEEKSSEEGNHFEMNHLKIANSHLKSTIYQDKEGVIQATIRGKVLDLSHILDDSAPEPLLKPTPQQDDKEGLQVKVKLHLDKVNLGKNNAIHQVSGDMLYRQNTLISANLKGKANHNDASISLNMAPLSNDRQQFTLQSGDGGHLLEMLGAGYDVEGGHLVIKGIKSEKRSNTEVSKWEIAGNISIDDFTINKAPLLARLLSAASLNGIVNFFSGKGIHFYQGAADFSLTPENLSLKNVRLISPSLGLLLNGSLNRLSHKVHFAGELIPLYIMNKALAQIPVIGPLISGGREDGIFLTQFMLTGDRQDPTLAINPITSITPGLVREFLTTQEAKP